MHEAEGDDEGVEEEEDEEEHAPSTLVNHPVVEFLRHRGGHERRDGLGRGGCGALKTLKTATLGLVALEVGGLGAIDDDVGVLLERGDLAVREIHLGLAPSVERHRLRTTCRGRVGRSGQTRAKSTSCAEEGLPAVNDKDKDGRGERKGARSWWSAEEPFCDLRHAFWASPRLTALCCYGKPAHPPTAPSSSLQPSLGPAPRAPAAPQSGPPARCLPRRRRALLLAARPPRRPRPASQTASAPHTARAGETIIARTRHHATTTLPGEAGRSSQPRRRQRCARCCATCLTISTFAHIIHL